MLSGNKVGNRTTATAALTMAILATAAQAEILKLGIGVRETGSTAAIGAPSTPNTGEIEWVRGQDATALPLTADGTWQFFTYTFGVDPVTAVTGVSGTGALSSATMKGALEHIAIRNGQPTSSEIKIYFDDLTHTVVNSVAGTAPGTYVLADWEAQAFGTEHMFQEPRFSGSTSASLAETPNVARVVDNTVTAPHGGNNSYEVNFRFTSPSVNLWDRLTTSGFNPTIDYAAGNSISFWAKATIAPPTMFWNVWTGGSWGTGSNWSNAGPEPIPGVSTAIGGDPNGGSDTARFLTPATGTPQPQTVSLDGDRYLNQLLIDNVQRYTFNNGALIMTSTTNPPRNGTATIATVNGSHTIDVSDLFINSSLTFNIGGAANTLTVNSPISPIPTLDTTATNAQLQITKSGDGTLQLNNDLNYGYLVISGGTVNAASGKTLNLGFHETAALLPVTAATSRQAIFITTAGTLNLNNNNLTLTYRFVDNNTTDANGDTSLTTEGSILNDGTLNMSGGTLSTTRITISSVRGDLNLTNGASVTANYLAQDVVTVANSTITIRPNGGTGHLGGVSSLQGLSITGTGTIELNNNDLAFLATAPSNATIRGWLLSGRNGGAWNGTGIRSAAAAAEANHLTALGYASGAQLFGASNGSISGHGIAPDGAIIKYTYYGDATLDGKVNLDDYARIDRGMAMGLSDWVDGDFDYNGIINSADYFLIDKSFGLQSGVLSADLLALRASQFGSDYVSQLVSSVPEPTGIAVIGLVAAGLTTRRRRQQV